MAAGAQTCSRELERKQSMRDLKQLHMWDASVAEHGVTCAAMPILKCNDFI